MNKKLAIDGVYSAVILDLGGVLIDINIVATVEKFAKLGLKNIDKHISQSHAGGGIYTDFERGLITPAQFFDAVRAEIGHYVTDESIADAWNAMLGVFPLQRVKLIERLRSKLPVLLLSNTNVLHKECFDGCAPGYDSFSQLFDGVWLSHEMHMSKPDIEICKAVIENNGLDASRTLFLDDSQLNVDGARSAGLIAHRITPECDVLRFFTDYDF